MLESDAVCDKDKTDLNDSGKFFTNTHKILKHIGNKVYSKQAPGCTVMTKPVFWLAFFSLILILSGFEGEQHDRDSSGMINIYTDYC